MCVCVCVCVCAYLRFSYKTLNTNIIKDSWEMYSFEDNLQPIISLVSCFQIYIPAMESVNLKKLPSFVDSLLYLKAE